MSHPDTARAKTLHTSHTLLFNICPHINHSKDCVCLLTALHSSTQALKHSSTQALNAAFKCAQIALIALSVFGVSACSDGGGSSGGSDSGTKDTTAPTLTLNPESGAGIGSASDKKPAFTATFSENVKNVNATNVVFKQGSTVLATAISGADQSYTITPNAALTSNTNYTLEFKAGITDAAGNALVAVNNSYSTGDINAPTLTVTPTDNATNVSRKPNINLSFSETVTGVTTANVLLSKNSDGSSPVAATLSGSTSPYTLTPTAKLEHNTQYYVVVKAAKIKDAANNALGSANQITRFTTYKGEHAFTAWVGATDSKIDIDGRLLNGAELYSYRNKNCDIANITACTQGQSLLLNNQTITDPALNLTNSAYYKTQYQSQTAESVASTTKFTARNGQAVAFNGKLWVIGGYDGNFKNDVWSSTDGVTWTKVLAHAATASSTQFSARNSHQPVAFDGKLWVIGGFDGNYKNDVWSSTDGSTWTNVLAHAATASSTQFSPRKSHQVVVFGGKLWVIGGIGVGRKNDVWSSTNGSTWTQVIANAPFSKRGGHQVVAFNGKLWVIGGDEKNDVWSSPDGISWTNVLAHAATAASTQFSARDAHQAVAFDGKLWVIGGYDGRDGSYNRKNDVWSSTDGSTWTNVLAHAATAASTQFSARKYHQAVAFGGKLWVMGGSDGNRKNDVWQSTDGITWNEPTANGAFSARLGHQAVALNNKLWLVGGNNGSPTNDVWSSTNGVTWTNVLAHAATAPSTQFSARSNHQTVAFDGKLWVIGGNDSDGDKNDVWSSPDGVTWNRVTANANFSARQEHQAVAFDDKLWVIGGYDGNYNNDVWSSLDGVTWTQVATGAQFSARAYHQAVAFDGKLWVMGGNDGSDKNDVWSSSDGITWTQVLAHAATAPSTQFSARIYHQAGAFDGKLWVIGGSDGSKKNDVWSSTDGSTWTRKTANAAFSARNSHQVVTFKNKLFVIGGDDGKNKNDVWSSDDGITWRKGYSGTLKMP